MVAKSSDASSAAWPLTMMGVVSLVLLPVAVAVAAVVVLLEVVMVRVSSGVAIDR